MVLSREEINIEVLKCEEALKQIKYGKEVNELMLEALKGLKNYAPIHRNKRDKNLGRRTNK